MRTKRILLLALTVSLIAAVGIGNAYAYSWGSNDKSELQDSGYSMVNTVTGTPPVFVGGTLSWENYVKNYKTSFYYPSIFWQWNVGGYWDKDECNYAVANGAAWYHVVSDAEAYTSSGSQYMIVKHRFGESQGGTDYVTQTSQGYTTYT